MQQPLEHAFIRRLQAGDRQALSSWYDQAAPLLLGVCMRYTHETPDAEDLLHNALIKVIGSLPSFVYQGPGGFEAWVKRIVVNTALNQLRSKGRLNLTPLQEDRMADQAPEEDMDDDPVIPEPDLLIRWIQELPPGYRTVLNMYVFESYSHKEIAELLNISENTSKSQLSKARAFLRRKMQVVDQPIHHHG